jgi:Fur family ferric uptake transcriptional regulator
MRIGSDQSPQALHRQLSAGTPSLGLATVYRTLSALADAGLLDRIHRGDSTARYRYCAPGHHHHLTCSSCDTIVEIRECDLDDWAQRVGRSYGFSHIEHAVELRGRCGTCSHATDAADEDGA